MINKNLTCHVDSVCSANAVQTLNVKIESQLEGALYLSYELTGDLAQILIPAPQVPAVVDGLWEHTCFELFAAVEGEAGYHEFNFSPSGHWAAYAFSDYRVRSAWTASQAPTIRFAQSNVRSLLEVVVFADDLPQSCAGKLLQLGLTAVIEAEDGSRSYWALHHPKACPDFHHRAGFILPLKQKLLINRS